VAIKGSKVIHQNREEPRASANGRRWSAIPPLPFWVGTRSSERGILAFSRDPSIHSDYILSPVFCILFSVSWILVLEDLPC
jgi:hypothetical protein